MKRQMWKPALAGILIAGTLAVSYGLIRVVVGSSSSSDSITPAAAPQGPSPNPFRTATPPPLRHCSDWQKSEDPQKRRLVTTFAYVVAWQVELGAGTEAPPLTNDESDLIAASFDDLCGGPDSDPQYLVAESLPFLLESDPRLAGLRPTAR